jgi:hypothetical protein
LFERVFVRDKEGLNDLFGGFVDFIDERDFMDQPIAHAQNLSEKIFSSDESQKKGEEEKGDENYDLAHGPDELLGANECTDRKTVKNCDCNAHEWFCEKTHDKVDDPKGHCKRQKSQEPGNEVLLHKPHDGEQVFISQGSESTSRAMCLRPEKR